MEKIKDMNNIGYEQKYNMLISLFNEKKFNQTIDLANEMIDKFGESHKIHIIKGDCYFQKRSYLTALAEYKIANQGLIDDYDLIIKLSMTHLRLGSIKHALELITETISKVPAYESRLRGIFGDKFIENCIQKIRKNNYKNEIDKNLGKEFDLALYKRLYSDLAELKDNLIIKHYEEYGKNENRIASKAQLKDAVSKMKNDLPLDFDINSYLLLNQELLKLIGKENSNEEIFYILGNHFQIYGEREKRKYSYPERFADESLYISMKKISNSLTNVESLLDNFIKSKTKLNFFNNNPKISYIVPVYGRFDLLLMLLFSLDAQLDKSFEVVIYDNSSPDEIKDLFYSKIQAKIVKSKKNLHYLQGCNNASKLANGEILVFLNSDVTLFPTNTSQIIESFNTIPNLGVLGASICSNDIVLQESGSVIFSDGSTKGVGRGFARDAFWLRYDRDVDYVSGCFLATRRKTFIDNLGFDERFKPAYYEDVDYCVRVKLNGKRVIVRPSIQIRHVEYASEVKNSSAVAMQDKNRTTFCKIHSRFLEKKYTNSEYHELRADLVGDFSLLKGKKILFIDDCAPNYSSGSGYGRAQDILKNFLKNGFFVTHISIARDLNKDKNSNNLSFYKNTEFVLDSTHDEIELLLSKRKNFYDYVFVSRRHNVLKYLNSYNKYFENIKKIYDVEALFSVRDYIHKLGPTFSPLDYLDYIKSIEYVDEASLYATADAITFASKLELLAFDEQNNIGVPLFELGHHFELHQKSNNSFENRNGLIFFGAVNDLNSPNYDSLNIILNDIIPKLRKTKFLNNKFIIAGNIKDPMIVSEIHRYCMEDKNTFFFSELNDIEGMLVNTRLFISPTRMAAGIPHKIGTAAKCGVPVVASSLLCQQTANTQYFYEANSVDNFINGINDLYFNKKNWNKYHALSLKYIREECNQEKFSKFFTRIRNI